MANSTVKASNFGPHGSFGLLLHKCLLVVAIVKTCPAQNDMKDVLKLYLKVATYVVSVDFCILFTRRNYGSCKKKRFKIFTRFKVGVFKEILEPEGIRSIIFHQKHSKWLASLFNFQKTLHLTVSDVMRCERHGLLR
jgi:hypothetical protein